MIIEALELRRHFSVSVTEMYPGFYEVQGDSSADIIDISVSMNDETFTLDETTYSGVAYIYIHGAGGDDMINVYSVDGAGSIGAAITGGDGNDYIALNFDGGIWAGAGNDVFYLSDSFRGTAHGNTGNDQMFISGACYDAEIIGDEGNDLIDCSANYYPVIIHAGAGNDTAYGSAYNDQIYGEGGNDYLYGGGGNDSFYAINGHGGLVDGGDGYDIVYSSEFTYNGANIEESYTF